MMEKRKRYRIADAEIEIAFTENYTEIICRDYEVKAEGKPDFVIEVTVQVHLIHQHVIQDVSGLVWYRMTEAFSGRIIRM